ncbi:flagellar hook associated protein [Ligilactobacillus salitolerans]|uniref:Flagellar hook-associated protein 1 n=1 Tax=Ligilactobacillus salitolerans TaxID=1808352 RepID=A0A401ITN0_9LACO|nr:flagellar hook-associated protein FlgK [Ligilactobacillus salitolerans]GBG94900.1 flagellar hook associated protein [Ligilactobacillus salitolerans]
MSGLFGTLNTARSGLDANQVALQTSSHNIANTNTDGYTRQRVDLGTKIPYHKTGVGLIGTGVSANGVERIVDDFVRSQVRDSNANYNFNVQKSDVLGLLEDALHEPSDDGVITQLNNYADSLQKLADNPELDTAKTNAVQMGVSLATYIQSIAKQVGKVNGDTQSQLSKTVLDFNQMAGELANLNQQIYDSHLDDETPNDLLDRRDSLLKDMSGQADITVAFDNYGRTTVSIGDQEIVNGKLGVQQKLSVVVGAAAGTAEIYPDGDETQSKQEITGNFAVGDVVLSAADGTENYSVLEVKSGSIGGLQESLAEVQAHQDELNSFVNGLIASQNIVYSEGTNATNAFFESDDPTNPALSLRVNQDLVKDPGKMKVGAGADPADGDNSLALAMAKSLKAKLDYPVDPADLLTNFDPTSLTFTASEQGMTVAGSYNSIVTKNGISKQKADNMASAQLTALNQLEYKDQAASGVNLNEEMSDVIRFQQGFQANARLLTVVSDMLDTLINRTGV